MTPADGGKELGVQGYRDRLVSLDRLPPLPSLRGKPEVRGWDVCVADGARVGRVDDLVVDTRAMRVRYLAVSLDDLASREVSHESRLLIPVGAAHVDRAERRVRLDGLGREEVLGLPAYLRMPPAPEYETTLRRRFEPSFVGEAQDEGFFASALYDPDRFFGTGHPAPRPA